MEHISAIRFSVIIPAYNETQLPPRLLDSIDVARSAYHGGREAIEVIVADNSSTDKTSEIAISRGCRLAHVSKRSIGAARNGGSDIASGDILCFIDADFQVHPRTFDVIEEALSSGRFIGGATGVVFCRREDFHAIGGYDESRLYAEDVLFLVAVRRRGRLRGQGLTRLGALKAIASTRKFDEFGDWHYFSLFVRAGIGLITGRTSDNEIINRYWYKPQR